MSDLVEDRFSRVLAHFKIGRWKKLCRQTKIMDMPAPDMQNPLFYFCTWSERNYIWKQQISKLLLIRQLQIRQTTLVHTNIIIPSILHVDTLEKHQQNSDGPDESHYDR